jgi:hypothetical protein
MVCKWAIKVAFRHMLKSVLPRWISFLICPVAWHLVLNTTPVGHGTHVMTYAYPRYENIRNEGTQILNLMPDYYQGTIVEYLPTGRDRVLLAGPCYRTNIEILHGASGGPVFSKGGAVFALNSTGWDGTNDSYISSINGILDLAIDDIAIGQDPPCRVSVRELASAGHITVRP